MAQGELRLLQKGQSGVGGQHPGGVALQQPGGQLALEPADLLAQRRRRHAQVERRLAHAAGLANPDEVTQLAQFHGGCKL